MTTECTPSDRQQNPIDARLDRLMDSVSAWSALFVGATSVVLSREIAERLPFGDFYQALALLPVTLAVVYVLLVLAVRLEGRDR
ncbi:hypothetical protein [Halobacterium wangiae]|uniref:hypothetical protein n=1 Tax=Halobacterium wangiae TaxID=2902623 RepID=UPI001E520589|nr:hypothetical protein [Halobacterium wangiae]